MDDKTKIRLISKYEASNNPNKCLDVKNFTKKLLKAKIWHGKGINSQKVQKAIKTYKTEGSSVFEYDDGLWRLKQ
nr:hypothetical protein [Methanobrevibacter arboriphilus]